jgi:hypothetical protein
MKEREREREGKKFGEEKKINGSMKEDREKGRRERMGRILQLIHAARIICMI